MRTTSKLDRIDQPHKMAAVLNPTMDAIPTVKSDGDIDWICSGCDVMLIEGMSEERLKEQFHTPVQMAIKCPACSSFSRIPATVGN